MTRIKTSLNFQNTFSKRLKKIREKRELSQSDLAEKIGIDVRTYQKYESDSIASPKNRSVPSFEMIQNICNILKCDMEYLAGEGQEDDFEKSTKIPTEYLNLKYDAVEQIKGYPPEIKEFLNRMILNSNSDNLLKLLQAMYIYSIEAHHSIVQLEVPAANHSEKLDVEDDLIGSNIDNPLPEISKKMLQYSASTTFSKILLDAYVDYIDDSNVLLKKRLKKCAELEKKQYLRVYENMKAGLHLTIEDFSVLYGDVIGNDLPSQAERFNQIDEKYKNEYNRLKEPPFKK